MYSEIPWKVQGLYRKDKRTVLKKVHGKYPQTSRKIPGRTGKVLKKVIKERLRKVMGNTSKVLRKQCAKMEKDHFTKHCNQAKKANSFIL